MKSIRKLMLIGIFVMPLLTSSCFGGSVIFGKKCYVQEMISAENENYIINERCLYDKNKHTYTTFIDLNKLYYYPGSSLLSITLNEDNFTFDYKDGKDIYNYQGMAISISKHENEPSTNNSFYSSYQRENWDDKLLTVDEKNIYEYAKSKSIKDEFPYLIEGRLKDMGNTIIFNVNVYDKIMWKGSALINQGIIYSSLNKYDKITMQIETIKEFNKGAIKAFYDDSLYYYNKKDNALYYYDLNTHKSQFIYKVNNNLRFYVTKQYCLIENIATINTVYKIIEIN